VPLAAQGIDLRAAVAGMTTMREYGYFEDRDRGCERDRDQGCERDRDLATATGYDPTHASSEP